MAREHIFIDEILQDGRPTYELTLSAHSDVIVDILVQALREAFMNDPVYTYVPREDFSGPDFDLTQIVIVDKYTYDAIFLPAITFAIGSVNTHWIQFSQSPFNTVLKPQLNTDGSIKRDERGRMVPSHYEYTGAYLSSVTILISASDTLEREELANRLHVYLAESLRDNLMVRGLFVRNVNVGGQTEEEYRNDYIYQVPVNAEIYSEWKRKIPIGETLKSIGFDFDVVGLNQQPPPEPTFKGPPIEIHELKTEYFVEDPNTGENIIPELLFSATSQDAPVALVFNDMANRWEVSDFWRAAIESTLIPYENFLIELNKESEAQTYLDHAARSIINAETLRALSLSQGRVLADGTKVIKGSFVYEDGTVELKGGTNPNIPLIFSTIVEPNNNVKVRFIKTNRNRDVLVAKNVVYDGYGVATSGSISKRIVDGYGNTTDIQLSTADQEFLSGENINTMTAVDLFMIMQFAQQPFRYSIGMILDESDKLLEQLGDMSINIPDRMDKIASITNIKQNLIARTETFLLRQPVGL